MHVMPNRSWGGAEIQMLEIAEWTRELSAQNASQKFESKIWCVKDSPIYREATRLGFQTVTDPLPYKAAIPPLWRTVSVIKREKVDVVHIHWAAGMRLFYGVKWFCDVKIVFYNHMWVTLDKKDLVHRLAYREVDKMTVSGPRGYQAIMQHLPVTKEQLVLHPYGIDMRKISPKRDRAKWGLPEDALVFGYFGRLDRQKGVKEFILASKALLAKFPKLHILLVGDPTMNEADAIRYKEEVFSLIESHPHRDRIHQFGHQSDFHAPMSCCDLIVMPSYMECYSILILHAFALGLPVVSTDAGGTPDLLNAPERGWLVKSKDVESLEKTLIEIALHPAIIREKSESCLTYVSKNHTHDVVARSMAAIYSSL